MNIYGKNTVIEALKTRDDVSKIIISTSNHEMIPLVKKLIKNKNIEIQELPLNKMNQMFPKNHQGTKSQGVCAMGGQRRPPLQGRTGTVRSGTSRTPCPTHSVIARSEATRQSVLPSPKRRIPAPVTRSLVRNDSAPRWERRDTWVPPYGVRRSSRAGRGVRPYKRLSGFRAGRRGRRVLRCCDEAPRGAFSQPVGLLW